MCPLIRWKNFISSYSWTKTRVFLGTVYSQQQLLCTAPVLYHFVLILDCYTSPMACIKEKIWKLPCRWLWYCAHPWNFSISWCMPCREKLQTKKKEDFTVYGVWRLMPSPNAWRKPCLSNIGWQWNKVLYPAYPLQKQKWWKECWRDWRHRVVCQAAGQHPF